MCETGLNRGYEPEFFCNRSPNVDIKQRNGCDSGEGSLGNIVSHLRGTKVNEDTDLTQSRNALRLIFFLLHSLFHGRYGVHKPTDVVEGVSFERKLAKHPVIRY